MAGCMVVVIRAIVVVVVVEIHPARRYLHAMRHD